MFKKKIQRQEDELPEIKEEIRKPMMKKPIQQEEVEEVEEEDEEVEEQPEEKPAKKPLTITDLMNAITDDRNVLIQQNARIEALEAALFRLKALV